MPEIKLTQEEMEVILLIKKKSAEPNEKNN
jgi:hypothetical protein